MKTKKIAVTNRKRENNTFCKHDYKNAIKTGNIDYVCPLCRNLLDPMEWFFMNSFEFVEVSAESKKVAKAGNARKELEKELGRSVVSKNNFKLLNNRKKLNK